MIEHILESIDAKISELDAQQAQLDDGRKHLPSGSPLKTFFLDGRPATKADGLRMARTILENYQDDEPFIPPPPLDPASLPQAIEYWKITADTASLDVDTLNASGNAGWQLITITPECKNHRMIFTFLFSRPKRAEIGDMP